MNERTMSPEIGSQNIWEAAWPSQRCTATKVSTGVQCKAWAIRGGSVCVYHGGSAPQVKAAARRRLEALVPLALEVLSDLAMGSAIDPESGQAVSVPPAVRQRAADSILRNSGVAAPSEVDVTVSENFNPDLDAAIAQALARVTGG